MRSNAAPRDWLAIAEVGTAFGLQFVVGLYRLLGRAATTVFLRVLAGYYLLLNGQSRRASFDFWKRVTGSSSWRQAYRHFVTFAVVTFDRLVFATGRGGRLEVRTTGREHLRALAAEKKGALLLGAHVGSFECMRSTSQEVSLPITIVANFGNAERINRVLERLNPGLNTRVIGISGESFDSILRIRECVERGELVAILADRARPGARAVTVDFLGGKVRLPVGPFILAASIGCPVVMTFGLYRGGARYDLFCERFADKVVLPRGNREEALQTVAQRYADRLAHYVKQEPDNWFNFYQYWE